MHPTILTEQDGGTIASTLSGLALNNLGQAKVQFGWVFSNSISTDDEDAEALKETLELNPCLVQSLYMLKLLVWDGPTIFLGIIDIVASEKILAKVVSWWKTLPAAVQTNLASFLNAIQAVLTPTSTPAAGLRQFLAQTVTLITEMYEEGILWAFFKNIISGWSWVEGAMLVLNLLKLGFDLTANFEVKIAFFLAELVDWAFQVYGAIGPWKKACWPNSASLASRANIGLLMKHVSSITETTAYKALPLREKTEAIYTLIAPHYDRIVNGEHKLMFSTSLTDIFFAYRRPSLAL